MTGRSRGRAAVTVSRPAVSQQRVAVGDDTGTVAVFEMKKGTPEVRLPRVRRCRRREKRKRRAGRSALGTGRSLRLLAVDGRGARRAPSPSHLTVFSPAAQVEFKSDPVEQRVARLVLGGEPDKKDKIFVSMGQAVVGINKKGKQFFRFSTNLAATITSMYIEDTYIWSGADNNYSVFDNGREVVSMLMPDAIGDLTCEHVTRDTEYDAVVGCADRFLRVIQGSTVAMEIATDALVSDPARGTALTAAGVTGGVQVVARYPGHLAARAAGSMGDGSASGGGAAAGGGGGGGGRTWVHDALHFKHLLYGTSGGQVGLVMADKRSMRRGWTIPNAGKAKGGAITALTHLDVTADGVPDVVVARDDGSIQVFSFDVGPEPLLSFKYAGTESVQSMETGKVVSAEKTEVIFCTYSGKVASMTTDAVESADADDRYGRSKVRAEETGAGTDGKSGMWGGEVGWTLSGRRRCPPALVLS